MTKATKAFNVFVTKIISVNADNGMAQVKIDDVTFGNVIGKDSVIKPVETAELGRNVTEKRFEVDGVVFFSRYQYWKDEGSYSSHFYMNVKDAKARLNTTGIAGKKSMIGDMAGYVAQAVA